MTAARRAISRARRAWATPLAAALTLAALAMPAASVPGTAVASYGSGGTAAPVASSSQEAVNVAGVGGTQAPVYKGTGGSEYGVAQTSAKKASHPARRSSHSKHAHKPKPKPAPKPTPKPAPAPSPAPATPPGLPTPAQTVGEGAVFPVRGPHSFGGPENRFGAPRSGHTHQGQDVLAAEGLPDVAPLPGTILTTGNQEGGAGWYVAETASDGFTLFFAHCQASSIAVKPGQAVSAGTTLCGLGATGDATGPHLHFEMWVGGWHAPGGYPIDPLPYLEAWEGH